MASGLLAFVCRKSQNASAKTHFDQIPLQTVKRIVEEQTRREEVAQAALRERLQVMTCGASEQNKRLVAFDVGSAIESPARATVVCSRVR